MERAGETAQNREKMPVTRSENLRNRKEHLRLSRRRLLTHCQFKNVVE